MKLKGANILIESLQKERDSILELLKNSTVKLEIPFIKITNLKKAVQTLGADRVKLEVNPKDKVLSAVVYDDKTRSTATVELGEADGDFKNTYNADLLVRLMDQVDDTVVLAVTMDEPMFLDLPKEGFCYMLSPWKTPASAQE